jgi:hypothetical protein
LKVLRLVLSAEWYLREGPQTCSIAESVLVSAGLDLAPALLRLSYSQWSAYYRLQAEQHFFAFPTEQPGLHGLLTCWQWPWLPCL